MLNLAKQRFVRTPESSPEISPPSSATGDALGPVWNAVQAFIGWLERHGYESYDPYDIWGTSYGRFAKRAFYLKAVFGVALVAPLVALEALCPWLRVLFIQRQRYATADAQLALAFLNLYVLTEEPDFLAKAKGLAEDLLRTSVPGYSGLCWGYPFDWPNVNRFTPKNTPLITTTPYCFEAFLGLFDVTGDTRYLSLAESVAVFIANDIRDTPTWGGAMASSYAPDDECKVVNCSAYRAMVLFEAARRFANSDYERKAEANLQFVLQSQSSDGSWMYALDNPREAFLDHFHTCFVLKNLQKINVHLHRPALRKAIQVGFQFYKKNLFRPHGLPKPFLIEPRRQIVRLEMYDLAEAINLGCLLKKDATDAYEIATRLAALLCSRLQLRNGHFITRIYRGGFRHKFPFLRWPQAQLFYALTNLLRSRQVQ